MLTAFIFRERKLYTGVRSGIDDADTTRSGRDHPSAVRSTAKRVSSSSSKAQRKDSGQPSLVIGAAEGSSKLAGLSSRADHQRQKRFTTAAESVQQSALKLPPYGGDELLDTYLTQVQLAGQFQG